MKCTTTPVFLLIAAVWLTGCGSPPQAATPAKPSAEKPAVAVAHPKLETLERKVTLSGEFRPYQAVDLHTKVSGFLKDITVDVGSYVKAGQTIATLEIPEMEAELAQSASERLRTEAELPRTQAEIARAEANLRLATVAHNRLVAAAKAEPGIVAQQEIDEALARQQAAQAQLTSIRAGLQVDQQRILTAKAAEQRTKTMAAYKVITAPFAGVITKRLADPGAMVQVGASSQPVVRLADLSRLRLAVTAPESLVPMIRQGQPVDIYVSSLNQTFRGTVARLSRDVLADSRTMEVEVDVPNPGNTLTPGMYAEVVMNLERRQEGLTVPVTAIINGGGNRSVYLVNQAGEVEERAIKTGIESPASIEVIAGLTADDRVVIGNRSLLRPGQAVEAKLAGDR